jgi:hypothetical protein
VHIQNVERQNVERQNIERQNVERQNVDTSKRRHIKTSTTTKCIKKNFLFEATVYTRMSIGS